MPTAEAPRRWAWPLLAGVIAVALGLRLWGIRQGLPYAYNTDEADHFVPRAVSMFAHGLNPHYFSNPPAYTYLLHVVFAIAYGGKQGVLHEFAFHPASVYTLARVVAALLGVAAVWLTYLAGARLLGRAGGLLAAAIEAVAFLPVYYAHVAVNDVPTLAPLTLSLVGSAGVLRTGRTREVLLAGAGLGLACASKYTAGIALAPLAAAIAVRYVQEDAGAGRRALVRLGLAGSVALGAFLLANPYAVLDYSSFHQGVVHQSTLASEAQGKLGAPRHGGLVYYLWSLTWGLGWAPALAALGGAITVWRREPPPPREPGGACAALATRRRAQARGVSARARWESRRLSCLARCCWCRGSYTACTRAWCSRARTRAISRAHGWWRMCPRAPRSWRSPCRPTNGRAKRDPGPPPRATPTAGRSTPRWSCGSPPVARCARAARCNRFRSRTTCARSARR